MKLDFSYHSMKGYRDTEIKRDVIDEDAADKVVGLLTESSTPIQRTISPFGQPRSE